MPLNFPENSEEIENRLKADVSRAAPDANPYVANHWLSAQLVGFGRRLFDMYRDIDRAVQFAFPDTTFDEGIARYAAIYNINKNAATKSVGNAIAAGTVSSIIPIATTMATTITDTEGNALSLSYDSTAAATITDNVIIVVSINLSGQTATVETDGEHNLASNVPVTISGAIEPEYDTVDAAITVLSTTSFSYQITGSPTSPATGTIVAEYTSALVPIESIDFASNTVLLSSTPLNLQSPIAGVDDVLGVDAEGIIGGTDQEADASVQARTLEKTRNPVAHFNDNDIISLARTVPSVSKVFVQRAGTAIASISVTSINRTISIARVVTATPHELLPGDYVSITGAVEPEYNVTNEVVIVLSTTMFAYHVLGTPSTPATGTILTDSIIALGHVRVYFITDIDSNVIPNAALVTTVRDILLTIMPSTTSELDLEVIAPTAVSTDFDFTSILPNTVTMGPAITDNLTQFFAERTELGVDVDEDAYRSAIISTVDLTTGERLESFVLSAPVGDIVIANGEIATLGTSTLPAVPP